jgi:hypothetical protein
MKEYSSSSKVLGRSVVQPLDQSYVNQGDCDRKSQLVWDDDVDRFGRGVKFHQTVNIDNVQ